MSPVQLETKKDVLVISKFIDIFRKLIVQSKSDCFDPKGKVFLIEQLKYFIHNNQPIKIILPGFPCKSPNNSSKVFSILPDRGEEIALTNLENFCEQVKTFYAPGCELTIFSDGTTFSDLIGVSEETQEIYNTALKNMIKLRHIVWESLDSFFSSENGYDALRKEFMTQYYVQERDDLEFETLIENDEEMRLTYLGLKRFLFHDNPWTDSNSPQTTTSRLKKSGYFAKIMMQRNSALTRLLQEKFPHHIRLSIHDHNNAGPKFSVHLLPDDVRCVTPWHNVVVKNDCHEEISSFAY